MGGQAGLKMKNANMQALVLSSTVDCFGSLGTTDWQTRQADKVRDRQQQRRLAKHTKCAKIEQKDGLGVQFTRMGWVHQKSAGMLYESMLLCCLCES